MQYCIACGMPLIHPEDHAQNDEQSKFCLYCVNTDGSVKSCEEIFNGGVNFFLGQIGGEKIMAEKIVRKNMNRLPYWQDKNCALLQGEQATDEEFQAVMAKM